MTRTIRTRTARIAGVALALSAGAAGLAQTAETSQAPKRALVIAGAAADDPAVVAQAKRAADAKHADLRVVHTNGDQLGVTHRFAAAHYDSVVTVDVDERIAVAPVEGRYPETRFVATSPRDFAQALD